MFNCPCRLRIPREGRDKLSDQIEAWAKAKGRTGIGIEDDLWVTVDADPELCNALKKYFGDPAAWDGGLQDFLDFLKGFDDLL
ncbi:hypothetical protein ACN28S_67550 [Cystobacter fuscus]